MQYHLLAIDIDIIGCLEPVLPLPDHFQIQRFWDWKIDLTLRHNSKLKLMKAG